MSKEKRDKIMIRKVATFLLDLYGQTRRSSLFKHNLACCYMYLGVIK